MTRNDTDSNASTNPSGTPLVLNVARRITEELFRARPEWKRDALIDRVVAAHRENGGLNGPANPRNLVMRVLRNLKDDGFVENFSPGWWRWTAASESDDRAADSQATTGIAREAATESVADAAAGDIRAEVEVGNGPECIYVYFNPNDRVLAQLQGRETWECKVGRTGSSDAAYRILGQGTRTALSRLPVVGLVIRTEDSAALERALHSSLRLLEADVPDSPGSEWFFTSPERIQSWYQKYVLALGALNGSSREDE